MLAIPHYIVVAVFAGGGLTWTVDNQTWGTWTLGGGGLIGLLVFIAGVVLLFTARYPRGLFDFVMGLNRWVYRVLAYAALMTDQYLPFRLDPGGGELPLAPDPSPAQPGEGHAADDLVRT